MFKYADLYVEASDASLSAAHFTAASVSSKLHYYSLYNLGSHRNILSCVCVDLLACNCEHKASPSFSIEHFFPLPTLGACMEQPSLHDALPVCPS